MPIIDMTCPDPFERFRGHLIPVEVEARPSPDSSELSHIYYGQMLDIKKELEKFNRLLEEVEDDEVRTRAATDTDASESGADDPTGSTADPVVLSSHAHTVESPDAASPVAGMDATDITEHDRPVAAESTSPVSAEGAGFPDRASDSTQSSTGDADRSWKVVEHVHDDESGQQGPADAAPAKTDQQTTSADLIERRDRRSARDREAVKQTPVQREVPRTVPSGLPSQHVAAFDSLMKGARTALTDSHRTKPKTRPPVTVTLPSPEQLEEDLVRERGFRERFAPMVSERIEVFYDRMTSVQDGLAMLQDRMGVVVGVAAVVVLVAAGLVIVPRMLSGDGVLPSEPPAIMCSGMKAAPADVPATCMPATFRRRISCAVAVPPSVVDNRSWLPPVRKTPSDFSM